MKHSTYDLIIVGTGFASTFFLKKYLDKAPQSAKVLVLERGYLFPHAERLKEKKGEQSSYASLNSNHKDTFINHQPEKEWIFQTAFGGGSNCWYGCTPRFMPSDFRMKSLYGVANDWPLQYDDLDPYYTQAEEIMSISGPEETPFPRNSPYPQPPHVFTTVDKIMKEKWGNLYVNQPTARARVPVGNRGACCGSAVCFVCPVNAKFTIENSGLGVYEDERVELLSGAQVYALDTQQSSVKSVNFIQDGREQKASGELVALGANPIFNANILLNSGDSNAFTGKGLGEQLGLQVNVYLEDLACLGGSTWVTANGYMLYDGDHRKDYAACLMEASNFPFYRQKQGKWRDMASFRMIFEDLPQADNYVSTTADPLKPAIHFKGHSEYTLKGIEKMKEKMPEIVSCLPVEKIEYLEPHFSEAHIVGTTRMSATPAEGVVDKQLIHHQYRNLFVLGSGSFTTYSPANPTLTISALSLFAADHIF